MGINTLYLNQHDLQPYYYVTVTDSTGGAVNITGATIRITMRPEDSTALKINRSTVGITISDATAGRFQYAWQAADTDTIGIFDVEFEITPASGGKFTIPSRNQGVAHISIVADLDST